MPTVSDEAGAVLTAMLPWGVSVLFHAVVVVLAVFFIWAVIEAEMEEEVIIPDIRLSKTPGAPLTMKQMEKVKTASSRRSVTRQSTPTQTQSLTQTVNLKTSLIGVKGASGGKASPFGTGIDAGAGFKANFFGSGGNAKKIVFVVDAGGALMDTFPIIIRELKKTVQNLSDQQSFTIIFFSGDKKPVEVPVPRKGMKKATAEAKRRVIDWIDIKSHNIRPHGPADPLPAIRKALAYRPQLMYLLSDNIIGGGTGATMYEREQKSLIEEIRRANVGRTKINTIQFIYDEPMETLKLIAEEFGDGDRSYKFVTQEELYLK